MKKAKKRIAVTYKCTIHKYKGKLPCPDCKKRYEYNPNHE